MEAKDKTSFRPCTNTWKIDQHCSRGFWPAHIIVAKVSILSSSMKDSRIEKPKVLTQEMTIPQYTNNIEIFKKA